MIHIYTGEGKGKTTAALGLALRASGANLKVYIAQFTKGKRCSELNALKKLRNIRIEQFGTCRFIRTVTERDKMLAHKGYLAVKKAIAQNKYDVVILDEINVAVSLNLLTVIDILSLIKSVPKRTELILTGRNAPKVLIKKADLVSEIKEIKHYFKKGVVARKGIEF